MEIALLGPAEFFFLFVPTVFFSFLILIFGVSIFTYLIVIRIAPLVKASPDDRLNDFFKRINNIIKIWFLQYRQPRYMLAGIIHIAIFSGFVILSVRSMELVGIGLYSGYTIPGFGGVLGSLYGVLKDYAVTIVFFACIAALYRRLILKPVRYNVPKKYGKSSLKEALLVLFFISILMISESFFEASLESANFKSGFEVRSLAIMSLTWVLFKFLSGFSIQSLQLIHIISYYIHDALFFIFLCYLPFGKHFHVITSFFNVFFMRTEKGQIKKVFHGISDNELDTLDSFGIKKLEDFTWKHILDFYTCADCGRCSDNCPANIVGRPLSPRFFTIKARNLLFKNYPVYPYGSSFIEHSSLVGNIYDKDEIWSCTTCGACEEECPVGIEYIDKIVDLRRGLVDEGILPQSLQKPMKALEKRGNPWGKLEKNRAIWTTLLEKKYEVEIFNKKTNIEYLYFVDSITSYDDRMQNIAISTSIILNKIGIKFLILGKDEKDSGNEVRRFGEEMLFQMIKDSNTEKILKTGVKNIITSDPHAFNVLKNEYSNLPKVQHLSQLVEHFFNFGKIKFRRLDSDVDKIYTYHDPCYLGRHNDIYDSPRNVINAMDGVKFIEMSRNKDRSFCCGGGGLMLFYEPEEEQRMGVVRVKMAVESGANVILTACPFCLINIEDAIKVSGLEDKIKVMDFSEFVVEHIY